MLDHISIFATGATAIVVEAAPFLLLGSLLGAMVEVLVPERVMTRLMPGSAGGQLAAGLLAGLVLPTCECGVVPVARRLMAKGAPPRMAVPFMMAAPVVNPVVLASTLYAFQGDVMVVLMRVVMVLVPAVAMGLALGEADAAMLLRPDNGQAACGCGHDHGHGHGHIHDFRHDHGHARPKRWLAVARFTAAEFTSMLRFLVLGAAAASAFKTWLPPDLLAALAANPILAVGGLMALAVALCVCSETDAFVAASFTSFPMAARLAFMAIGPMLDLKLAAMFLGVFRRRMAVALMVVPAVTVFVMAVIMAQGGW